MRILGLCLINKYKLTAGHNILGTLCGTACSQVKFDSTKSTTFVDGGRTSSITFATGVGVDPVIGSNYKLTLRSAKDTVSVGGLSAKGISLFLITSQTAKFNIDPFSGIQGTLYWE